jgi:hypothetical protein
MWMFLRVGRSRESDTNALRKAVVEEQKRIDALARKNKKLEHELAGNDSILTN